MYVKMLDQGLIQQVSPLGWFTVTIISWALGWTVIPQYPRRISSSIPYGHQYPGMRVSLV